MAKTDMKKTVKETFKKAPPAQGFAVNKDADRGDAAYLDELEKGEEAEFSTPGIEALLKKPRSKLTDKEREMVEDYHLDNREELARSTFSSDIKVPKSRRGEEPAKRETPVAAPKPSAPSWSDPADLLTRFGEEVADLPSEAYQANLERAGREKRRLEGQKQAQLDRWFDLRQQNADANQQAPGRSPKTPEQWEALRNINDEIESLEQSRESSMDPGKVYHEIQRLKERRLKMPGGRAHLLQEANLTDEGATTSYEDYLLRE